MSHQCQITCTDLEAIDLFDPPDDPDAEETPAPLQSLGKDRVLPPPDDP